jgi:hypothetical protein
METNRNGANVENVWWKATTAKKITTKRRDTGLQQLCLVVSVTLLHGGLDSTRQVTSIKVGARNVGDAQELGEAQLSGLGTAKWGEE